MLFELLRVYGEEGFKKQRNFRNGCVSFLLFTVTKVSLEISKLHARMIRLLMSSERKYPPMTEQKMLEPASYLDVGRQDDED